MITDEIKDQRKYWRMQRLEKDIQLKAMEEHVGCTYNMISMHEKGKANLDPEKLTRYKQFIKEYESY